MNDENNEIHTIALGSMIVDIDVEYTFDDITEVTPGPKQTLVLEPIRLEELLVLCKSERL